MMPAVLIEMLYGKFFEKIIVSLGLMKMFYITKDSDEELCNCRTLIFDLL